MPATYCFGMEQIPAKGDMLFITGGEKDVLSLYAHGFNAICFNSETAQIPTSIIESLQLRFRHIILLYDADETGVREAHKQSEHLVEYKVLNLSLPLSGTKSEKDISDFFALGNGAKELKELLQLLAGGVGDGVAFHQGRKFLHPHHRLRRSAELPETCLRPFLHHSC